MQLSGVRLSVCPVQPPLLQVCCCGPGRQENDRLPQRRRANAGSVTLSAYVGVAEQRLV